MKTNELQKKSSKELKIELLNLLREKFNLRMRVIDGQARQTHLLKKVRHDIAHVKMLLMKKVNY